VIGLNNGLIKTIVCGCDNEQRMQKSLKDENCEVW